MSDMGAFFGAIGFLAFVVAVVWIIYAFIKKKPKKQPAIAMVVAFLLLGIGVANTDTSKHAKKPVATTSSSTSSSSSSASSSSSSASSSAPAKPAEAPAKPTASKDQLNAIFEKAKPDIMQVTKDLMVKDVAIEFDEQHNNIIVSAVVGDALKPELTTDLADRMVRRIASIANQENSDFKVPGGREYWGGIWDVYGCDMRISALSKSGNQDDWYIWEIVQPGVQGNHQWKLQKKYRK